MKQTLWGIVLLGLIASTAHASVITVPTGLNPGDQYRLAFVTSTTRDATSTNIADYNTFVTGVANTVPELLALGTTWKAIGSTATVAARDNTSTNPTVATGVPIYQLSNIKLADNNADLWDGNIDADFRWSETGIPLSVTVWTGTNPDGTADLGFTLGTVGNVTVGLANLNVTSSQWIALERDPNNTSRHLYAISAPITVSAVPVPGAVWFFSSALGVMGVMRRKISS